VYSRIGPRFDDESADDGQGTKCLMKDVTRSVASSQKRPSVFLGVEAAHLTTCHADGLPVPKAIEPAISRWANLIGWFMMSSLIPARPFSLVLIGYHWASEIPPHALQ